MKKLYNKHIDYYVECMFEKYEYSKKLEKVKEKIKIALYEKYYVDKENENMFQVLINDYHTVDDLLKLVDEDQQILTKISHLNNEEYFLKLKKYNRFLNISIILAIVSVIYFLQAVIYYKNNFIFLFLLGVVFLLMDFFYIKKKKGVFFYEGNYISNKELELLFDKIVRRSINWVMILYLQVIDLIYSSITIIFNSKMSEILELFNYRLLLLEILVFFVIKNILKMKYLTKSVDFEKEKHYWKALKRVGVGGCLYSFISIGIYYLFEKVFVISPITFFTSILIIFIFIYNFIFMNKLTYQTKKPHKIILITVSLCMVIGLGYHYLSRDIWMVQPYINSVKCLSETNNSIQYDDQTGVYTINNEHDDFKILQLTDIHLGGSVLSYDKDLKALKTAYYLIKQTRPDFIIVTGDLTFPVGYSSFSFNNTAPVEQFAAFMRNIGIPWAFTYGNHDTESYAASSKNDLNSLYKSLSYKTSKNLLYPYKQPSITGRNNQVIELRNQDGSLNQALFLIDSNAYTGNGFNKYDYIHDDQVKWYKENIERLNTEENKTISSLLFFHIPLQEYKTAYDLYEKGSKKVKYYFGSNDEEFMDKVCCSEYPSALFDTAVELKSTKGMFCGHDHYNNMSLEYKGIRLTYGMSIDYLAMPGIARDTKQRGATLITSHQDSTIDIKQIPYRR